MLRRAVCVIVFAAVVACSGGASTTTGSSAAATTPESTTTTHPVTPGSIPPFAEIEVAVAGGPHGDQLVNAAGMSVYMFALDDERSSTCEGACAGSWPPLLGDPTALEGVDQGLLGNVERSDGSIQVTYAGHPLYLYSGDATPGEVNGHNFNDVWFLVSPTGEAISR